MDPGVDLSNEADASSMALAAAEAAAAAEEQEQQLAAKQQQEQEEHQQQQQQQEPQQPSKLLPQQEQNNPAREVSLNDENSSQYLEAGTNNTSPTQPTDTDESMKIKCRICGKTQQEDPRPLCRFIPAPVDVNTASLAPSVVTFAQDISLHVFCGKTASILPNVNQPDLEILSKAGIKNKHGIGPEVNGALARTRSSTLQGEGIKEKTFYIVKEFEAHLAAIRSASLGQAAAAAMAAEQRLVASQPQYRHVNPMAMDHTGHQGAAPHSIEPSMDMYHSTSSAAMAHLSNTQHMHVSSIPKVVPHKAGQSYHKTTSHQRDQWGLAAPHVTVTSDGKIRCGCGGTHLPTGTAKGDASWRSHVMTKRHQKWMEENGLLGAV